MRDNVLKWADDVEAALEDYDIEGVDVQTVLALIRVESAGNARARRVGSQFCGLLQMGRMAGIDVGFEDDGKDTTEALMGDGPAAINAFLRYVDRYKARLVGCKNASRSVATLWKGGPGTAAYIKQTYETGRDITFGETVSAAQAAKGIPNLRAYLRRFDEYYEQYARWDA